MSASPAFLQRRPLAEARALLLAGVAPVKAEEIPVDEALGRIAAETVVARHPSPHYRASAMDGIALRSAVTWAAAASPLLLRVLAPGQEAPAPDEPCCVPVDTGSCLPDWADAVVRIEDTTSADGGIRIRSVVPPGNDVRGAGEDIEEGSVVLPGGACVRAWDIGALLATGTARVAVRRKPRVAILATGGEVVDPGSLATRGEAAASLPRAGQVIDFNSRVIASLVHEWGGSAHRLGIVADDETALAAVVADAARRFDVVCVIAGSSAGRKDFTIATLAREGEVIVHGVDIAPGRPVALARLRRDTAGSTPAIAIPGYPVSAIVVCEELLKPLVAALLGTAPSRRQLLTARLGRALPSRIGMEEFRRVLLVHHQGHPPVVALLPSGAASISSVARAHGWLRIPAHVEGLDAGTEVEIEMIVSRDEAEAAFVMAGPAGPLAAELEDLLRRSHRLLRVATLGLGPKDVAGSVARGEAHGAFVEALPPGSSLVLRCLPGFASPLAVVEGSQADRTLASAGAVACGD